MSLTNANLKATRAKEHLDTLRVELTAFDKTKPCRIQEKIDTKASLYRLQILVDDPPKHLSLIAGDVFGCLRASLDHVVWALVTDAIGSYAKGTQFPIFEQVNTRSFNKSTKGLPAGAITIIESLQPYHGGNAKAIKSSSLWRLNKMCNIDKHRRIPVHGSYTEFRLPDTIPKTMVTLDNDGVMNFPLSMKDQVKLNPNVTFNVTFGDSYEGVECTLSDIEKIYEFVANDVIPRFASFFK